MSARVIAARVFRWAGDRLGHAAYRLDPPAPYVPPEVEEPVPAVPTYAETLFAHLELADCFSSLHRDLRDTARA
jgi:hypothetical protein